MRNISLFVEDNAHEAFLSSILQCFASEYDVEIDLKSHMYGVDVERSSQS